MARRGRIADLQHEELRSAVSGERFAESTVLTDALGFKALFVHHDVLLPGRRASSRHFHTAREEMVLVLEGRVRAFSGAESFLLDAGDFVGFPPGEEGTHHIENVSDSPARLLVVASNPDEDRTIVRDTGALGNVAKAAPVRVRLAEVADAPAIAATERLVAASRGMLVAEPGEIPEDAYAPKIAALSSSGRYVVAEEEGQMRGHAALEPMHLRAIAHVFRLTIVVRLEHTGRGVGRAMMRDLLDWATEDPRVHKVELHVRATNARAIALYRAFGFEEEGRFRARVRLDEVTFIDDVAMAWFPSRARPRPASIVP